jgi:hypothetical protein
LVAQKRHKGGFSPRFSASWDPRVKPIRIFQTVSLDNRVNKMVDSLLRGGLEVVMNFMNSHL